MGNIDKTATITTADILELNAIGEAIFAEWFPNHRLGDPVPAHLPLSIERGAKELAAGLPPKSTSARSSPAP